MFGNIGLGACGSGLLENTTDVKLIALMTVRIRAEVVQRCRMTVSIFDCCKVM